MIPADDPHIRAFFEKHGSGEVCNASDISEEMREVGAVRFTAIKQHSPVLEQVLAIDGVQTHQRSMRALTSSAYYIRCKKCEILPVVTQAVVFHPQGIIRIFEDESIITAPPPAEFQWPVNDGYHFYLEYKCPLCAERSAVVATFRKKIAQLINSYIKWTNQPKNGSSPTAGFIACPTWITTYFHKKRIDLSYAQKTALACIKAYRDLKTSRDTRVLPLDKFQIEK